MWSGDWSTLLFLVTIFRWGTQVEILLSFVFYFSINRSCVLVLFSGLFT